MSHQNLLISFALCCLLEFVAFGMQRATLLMSREANVSPQISEMLLPTWFPVVWLVRLLKWIVLFAVAFTWSWGVAIGLLIANTILATFLPIPYSAYISTFRKRISQIKLLDIGTGTKLEEILNGSKIYRP